MQGLRVMLILTLTLVLVIVMFDGVHGDGGDAGDGKRMQSGAPLNYCFRSSKRTFRREYIHLVQLARYPTGSSLCFCCSNFTPDPCKVSKKHGPRPQGLVSVHKLVLGGSWVVTSGVISRGTITITHIGGLITPLITAHEPPSRSQC